MSSEQQENDTSPQENDTSPQENDASPRTPVSLESSSLLLLSPPMMHREENDVDENKEYPDGDQDDYMTRDNLGARQVPVFPMMGVALPQHSMDIDTNEQPFSTGRRRPAISTRIRSCSFDDRLPVPNIFLRPRYRTNLEASERASERIPIPRQENLPVNRRSYHRRSHTFDGTGYANMFESPARVHSPPSNITSFAMPYLGGHSQQPALQFSPLGSSSIDSSHITQGVARPIPYYGHSTFSSTPAASSIATNGTNGGFATISSGHSAFESPARSSSLHDDVSGSAGSIRNNSWVNILNEPLPVNEVRVVEPYEGELLGLYDSPNSNRSDHLIENLNSYNAVSLRNFDGQIFSSERPSPVHSPVQS